VRARIPVQEEFLNSGEKEANHRRGDDPDVPKLHVVEGEPAPPRVDRREQRDRRLAPTRGWDSLLGFRRRHRGRRDGERDNIYVDRYTHQDVALMLGIFVLNILDAFFTLRWLEMGGGEGNPLMDMLIQTNVQIFLLQKCVVVGLWLVVLVIHKNFRIARVGLWAAFILYTGILFYHFVLQSVGPPLPISGESLLIH